MVFTFLTLAGTIVLGALLGVTVAGEVGSMFGAIVGAAVGVMWLAGRRATTRIPAGTAVQHERVRVLCEATGQSADVDFVHDGKHWCDVASCSLCSPPEEVECRKRCLELMNDTRRPTRELQPS